MKDDKEIIEGEKNNGEKYVLEISPDTQKLLDRYSSLNINKEELLKKIHEKLK